MLGFGVGRDRGLHAISCGRFSLLHARTGKSEQNEGRGNMNIKMRCLTIIAVGMLMTASTAASDKIAACAGYCGTSCGKIISDDTGRLENRAFIWALGYLSGLNQSEGIDGEETNLADNDGMKIWLKNYCEENALDKYFVAVTALWVELRKKQGLKPDPKYW